MYAKTVLAPLLLISCLGVFVTPPANAATFVVAGGNLGTIPDATPTGRLVTFPVPALGAAVVGVSLSLTISHTFVGDLELALVAPGGVAGTIVFSRVGSDLASSDGDSSNLIGTYRFSDIGSLDLWAQAASVPAAGTILPGHYRAVSRGATGASNAGGCPTSLDGVFGGLSSAQASGVWRLALIDRAAPVEGGISAAGLTIEYGDAETLFANSFEAVAPLRCANKVIADFNADGRSDYILIGNNAGQAQWRVQTNLGGGLAAAETTFNLGTYATDQFDTFDLDGDRIADAAAWTEATGTYSVRLSSRLGSAAPMVIVHGQADDDPVQSGDYDGDGQDDLAVLRQPATNVNGVAVEMRVRHSNNGQVAVVPLGLSSAEFRRFVVGGFDYTGDGLADIAVQRPDFSTMPPPGPKRGEFTIYEGRLATALPFFLLGFPTDFVVPGNYVGDARSDITVSRSFTGSHIWDTRDSTTGAVNTVTFGLTGDFRILGDYDGDGLSDYAEWRGSGVPGFSKFLIRPSTAPTTTWTLVAGIAGDIPVAGERVK